MIQARRNENRFYRYPMRRISAIIDDAAGLQAALDSGRARRTVPVAAAERGEVAKMPGESRRGSTPAERDNLAFRTAVGGGDGLVIQPRGGAIRDAAETELRPSGGTRSAESSSP